MDYDDIQAEIERGVALSDLPSQATDQGPSLRERWQRTMRGEPVDRVPNFEFGYWGRTLEVWRDQGLPPEIKGERTAYAYFGIESSSHAPIDVTGFRPAFESCILSEDDEYRTERNGDGATVRINLKGDQSIPQHLDFGLKDRASWEPYKERLQQDPGRVPHNWAELVKAYAKRDYPLSVPIGSMTGSPRNWIGFENIAMMIYDDPELLEEIVETVCQLVCDTLEPILEDVTFDFGCGWEDICFNSGPIVGVDFMRNVVTPRYKRITDMLKKHGCDVFWYDTDGFTYPIVDCFLEGGVNCLFPVEVHAGSDPVELRRRWPGIHMQGGLDKMLLNDRDRMQAEVERIAPLVAEGHFLPGMDHRVPANVSLDNYKFYMKIKRDILGVGGTPQYDESNL